MWIIYCCTHSILAASKVKLFFEKISGRFSRYYRLVYSIIASCTLGFILYFQYSFASPVLINSKFIKYLSSILLVIPGLVIMIVSIVNYFKLMGFVRSLYQPKHPRGLKLDGIHKYVRHPLYAGTLLFIWGLFFIFPVLSNLIAGIIITGYVLIGVKFEEKKLCKEFGSLYSEYIVRVPMLIPRLKSIRQNKKRVAVWPPLNI
jgi:protein-S-isoprenylcysteine O-methyltransferase Ste14